MTPTSPSSPSSPSSTPPPEPPPDSASVGSTLWRLSLPIIGLNVLNVLALMVDTAMCGRLPDYETALTALGYAVQVLFLLMVAMIGLTVGTVALTARAWGGGSFERARHIIQQSSQLTIVLAVLVAIFGNLAATPVIQVLGASPEVIDACMLYLRPLLVCVVFNYLVVLYAAVFRAVGNTRIPFVVALVYNIINVVLNYMFILGNLGMPALGLRGAAIGTVIAQASGVVMLVWAMRSGSIPNLSFSLRFKPVDRVLALDLVKIGAPAALDMLILNAAFFSIIGMLGRLNEVAVAAHGVGLRIQALAFVPGMSISQATGALVGQALGRDDVPHARATLRVSVMMCTAVMGTLALILIAFAEPIVSLFNVPSGTELSEYSTMWIQILGAGMLPVGIYIAFVGLLQGSGATRISLMINVGTTLIFQIPGSYFLGFVLDWGIFGVWVAFPLSFFIKIVAGWLAYRSDVWAVTGARA